MAPDDSTGMRTMAEHEILEEYERGREEERLGSQQLDDVLGEALRLAMRLWSGGPNYAVRDCEARLRKLAESYGRVQSVPRRKKEIPHTLRRQVLERDAYRCQHCGAWSDLTLDHVIPEASGGPATLENLQVLCRSCNSRKGIAAPRNGE